jgi:hypothetical protein
MAEEDEDYEQDGGHPGWGIPGVQPVPGTAEPDQTKVLVRKPRAYHINQGAIDVCNHLDMEPADAIVWLQGELRRKTETRDLTVQLEDAFRKVAQAEGVMLHATQKEFFRELTASLLAAVKKEFDGS